MLRGLLATPGSTKGHRDRFEGGAAVAAFFLIGLLGGNFLLALIAVFIFFGAKERPRWSDKGS